MTLSNKLLLLILVSNKIKRWTVKSCKKRQLLFEIRISNGAKNGQRDRPTWLATP